MQDKRIIAVLTGDLIKSRRADNAAVAETFATLGQAANDFGKTHHLDLRFTRFRGDGWQAVLTEPTRILEGTIFLLARLMTTPNSLRTRIGIGVGTATSLGTANLSDADGAAFFTSGTLLDTMSPKRKLALAGETVDASQAAIIDLTEFITNSWTPTQAEAVAHLMCNYPRTHEKIAAELGITRQAVQSRLAGAGLAYFETAIGAFRHHSF